MSHCARQILERMRAEMKIPTESALNMGLMAAGHLGRANIAGSLFEERLDIGAPLKEEAFVSVSGTGGDGGWAWSGSGVESMCLGCGWWM